MIVVEKRPFYRLRRRVPGRSGHVSPRGMKKTNILDVVSVIGMLGQRRPALLTELVVLLA
jgi:hypothetical protein